MKPKQAFYLENKNEHLKSKEERILSYWPTNDGIAY